MKDSTKQILLYTLFVVYIFYFIFNQYPNFADDPGVGWHLRTGELISAQHRIPHEDPFLFYDSVRSWVSDQWLSDVLLFQVYQSASWPVLYLLLTIIFLGTFLGVCYFGLRRRAYGAVAVYIGLLLATRLAAIHFILRPVLFSILFFAVLYFQLSSLKIRAVRRSDFLKFPLLFICWANMHPSFVLGLATFAVLVMQKKLQIYLVLLFSLCALLTVLNPYGMELHFSILQLADSGFFMNLNSEWKAIEIGSSEFYISLLIAVCIFIGTLHSKAVKFLDFEFANFLIFFALIFHSIRFLPYFAIAALLPFVQSLDSIFYRLNKKFAAFSLPDLKLVHHLGIFAVLAVMLFPYGQEEGPSRELYPYACMETLNTFVSGPERYGVLAHPNMGGFITFQSKAVGGVNFLQPYVDDRNTLIGEAIYKEFFAEMKPVASVLSYIKRTKTSFLMLSKDSPLGQFLKEKKYFDQLDCRDEAILFDLRTN